MRQDVFPHIRRHPACCEWTPLRPAIPADDGGPDHLEISPAAPHPGPSRDTIRRTATVSRVAPCQSPSPVFYCSPTSRQLGSNHTASSPLQIVGTDTFSKDVFPPIPTVHQMVDGPRILYPQFAPHVAYHIPAYPTMSIPLRRLLAADCKLSGLTRSCDLLSMRHLLSDPLGDSLAWALSSKRRHYAIPPQSS